MKQRLKFCIGNYKTLLECSFRQMETKTYLEGNGCGRVLTGNQVLM